MGKLIGEWTSEYTYSAGKTSQHNVSFEQNEEGLLVGEGVNETGSRLTLELSYDAENSVLTGTWQEITSSSGEYGGAKFYGAVQFVLNDKHNSAQGKWVGFNSNKTRVNSGDWSLIKIKP